MTVTPSTHLLTDAATLAAATPTAATKAKALIDPDLDYAGMISALEETLYQAKKLLTAIIAGTDSGDGNAALLANLAATFS